jgi:hypothetical protein
MLELQIFFTALFVAREVIGAACGCDPAIRLIEIIEGLV